MCPANLSCFFSFILQINKIIQCYNKMHRTGQPACFRYQHHDFFPQEVLKTPFPTIEVRNHLADFNLIDNKKTTATLYLPV